MAAGSVLGLNVRSLSTLLERAFVRRQGGRYELHPLMRQYAAEKLSQRPEADTVRAQHAEYYCGLVESKSRFHMQVGQSAAFDELDREYNNITAAWEYASRTNRHDLLQRMLRTFAGYLADRQPPLERTRQVDVALASAVPDSALMADLLTVKGEFLTYPDPRTARGLLERALALTTKHRGKRASGPVHFALGRALSQVREFEEANRNYELAVELLKGSEHELLLGGCLCNLGINRLDSRETLRLYELAVAACRRTGNVSYLAIILSNLSSLHIEFFGDYAAALRYSQEALAIERREMKRPLNLIAYECQVAMCHIFLGDLEAAEEQLARLEGRAEREPLWDAFPYTVSDPRNWPRAFVHYSRYEDDQARAIAALQPNDATLELDTWLALESGDLQRAAPYREELTEFLESPCDPPTEARLRTVARLFDAYAYALESSRADEEPRAGAANLPMSTLLEVLQLVQRAQLVPLAFEAFLVAHAVLPEVAGKTLLELTATHPRAGVHARRRASDLLAAWPANAPKAHDTWLAPFREASPLSPESVLQLTEELEKRVDMWATEWSGLYA